MSVWSDWLQKYKISICRRRPVHWKVFLKCGSLLSYFYAFLSSRDRDRVSWHSPGSGPVAVNGTMEVAVYRKHAEISPAYLWDPGSEVRVLSPPLHYISKWQRSWCDAEFYRSKGQCGVWGAEGPKKRGDTGWRLPEKCQRDFLNHFLF